MIKIAQKLNELLPHFSKVLEIGVNKMQELSVYAKQNITKEQYIFFIPKDFIFTSFDEYPG